MMVTNHRESLNGNTATEHADTEDVEALEALRVALRAHCKADEEGKRKPKQ
jgi:hypothetical protein